VILICFVQRNFNGMKTTIFSTVGFVSKVDRYVITLLIPMLIKHLA
jgi:hypothetical protein